MAAENPRVEAYFAEPGKWQAELAVLRSILLDSPLTEEFKWRSPCYTFQNANLATIWRMKDTCGLSFFKGVLLKDAKGILVPPGPNSRSVRVIRFIDTVEIIVMEATLKDYILEAVEAEKAGRKVEFRKDDLEYPAELTERFDRDPRLKAAFKAMTPGRQRGYVLHFSQPKQTGTRASRIDKCGPRILAGKGMHDR